jgi:hypothetical protein
MWLPRWLQLVGGSAGMVTVGGLVARPSVSPPAVVAPSSVAPNYAGPLQAKISKLFAQHNADLLREAGDVATGRPRVVGAPAPVGGLGDQVDSVPVAGLGRVWAFQGSAGSAPVQVAPQEGWTGQAPEGAQPSPAEQAGGASSGSPEGGNGQAQPEVAGNGIWLPRTYIDQAAPGLLDQAQAAQSAAQEGQQ